MLKSVLPKGMTISEQHVTFLKIIDKTHEKI